MCLGMFVSGFFWKKFTDYKNDEVTKTWLEEVEPSAFYLLSSLNAESLRNIYISVSVSDLSPEISDCTIFVQLLYDDLTL